MPDIKRVGFFHFGSNDKSDPVASLEKTLAEIPEGHLEDSLVVLPEAFNVRGDFYSPTPDLDPQAWARLSRIAKDRRAVFVAGLVEGVGSWNSAYLISGDHDPILLSRKRTPGWDCLYKPSESDETVAVIYGEVAITSLICDDAVHAGGDAERRAEIIRRIKDKGAKRNLLCIPGFMRRTDPVGTAALWADALTVVVANGCCSYPSVIRHREVVKPSTPSWVDQIHLCDLSGA